MKQRILSLLLCVLATAITANCACSSDDAGGSGSTKSSGLKNYGEAVKADDWEVTVVESKTQAEVKDSLFEHKAGEGAILHLVKVKLKNTGKEKKSPIFAEHALMDGATKYQPSADCSLGLKEKFGLSDINPGLAKTGWVCFEVPTTAKPSKYTFKGDPIMGDKVEFAYTAKAAPAGGEKKETAAKGGDLTCKALLGKVADLNKADGDKAFVKEKDVEPLSKGCEKVNALKTHEAAAKCTMDSKDRDAWGKCGKDVDKMMKAIMKAS